MKFLLDMGISPITGEYLAKKGHEAVHLIDIRMDRSTDLEILDLAEKENRVLLTHDLDFGRLLAFSAAKSPSVVTFRLKDMRPEKINKVIDLVIQRFSDVIEKGAILSVGDKKIRCHLLPIKR